MTSAGNPRTARDIARAERCFALARSTTFPAERDTAIAHGITIAEAAGIDLDRFDIPGRPRPRRSTTRWDSGPSQRPTTTASTRLAT
ncbi:hypothetical protein GCM10020258_12720 [Sphingomonas yabuuchiae]